MRKIRVSFSLVSTIGALLMAHGCNSPAPAGEPGTSPPAPLDDAARRALVEELAATHGAASRNDIDRGLKQVSALWRASDGDLAGFAREHFISDSAKRDATFARFEEQLEQLAGYLTAMRRELRWPIDVDTGELLPVDPLLAEIEPGAHLLEDLFRSKVAFVALLNFPLISLPIQVKDGPGFSRRQWAEARLTETFARRVPPSVTQEIARVGAAASLYIDQYNIWMHHVVTEKGERLFPSGMRLISHWNLRDELKSNYAAENGLAKQRLIAQVMERIVTQTIPAAVIDNPRVDWEPFSNAVTPAPPETVEANAPAARAAQPAGPEPAVRYQHWLAQFRAARAADPHSPSAPTAIARSFELERRMTEERARALLHEVLAAPQAKLVAERIRAKLRDGDPTRELQPFDIWFSGLRPQPALDEEGLSAETRERYPDAEAFAADIPRILRSVGFSPERADYLAERIEVDPARGAGHAMEARRRGDYPRLRTRIGAEGMDYKGYNIAIHELGHNVEQVISLYDIDHTLLAGVPNTGFTEAIAFVFQARDLELLGVTQARASSLIDEALHTYWMTFEIAGVGMLDLEVWHWLYDHPQATAAELGDAVVAAAKKIWNQYYAPVLGHSDVPLLAIYSHLVAYPLYVTDYSLGHLIQFQIEEHLSHNPVLGREIDRIARVGTITPDLWMMEATGQPVSAQPLLKAVQRALDGR